MLLVVLMIFSSCNLYKNVPSADYLYTGAKIKYDKSSKPDYETKSEMEKKCWPSPNKKILGFRFALRCYNASKPTKRKGINYFFHETLGEPPVLFTKVNTKETKRRLQEKAFDEGYLRVTIKDTIVYHK